MPSDDVRRVAHEARLLARYEREADRHGLKHPCTRRAWLEAVRVTDQNMAREAAREEIR